MKTDYEIVTRMRQLEKNRPSIYGNSFVVGLIYIATFVLSILLLTMYVMNKIEYQFAQDIIEWLGGIKPLPESLKAIDCKDALSKQQQSLMSNVLSQLYLVIGLLMLFINRLTRMIGRRNAFLMDFVEILEEEKKA
ncbi:MAG: hypothetical protein QE487_00680 [Fluviicola sp.]|nr:hypothetical protein [Fluviicola sp.]